MYFSSVTVVPLPFFDDTFSRSLKLSITENPSPERSSPPVVNSGSIAFSTSSIPQPRSFTLITTRPLANSFAWMVMLPMESGYACTMLSVSYTHLTACDHAGNRGRQPLFGGNGSEFGFGGRDVQFITTDVYKRQIKKLLHLNFLNHSL